MYNDEIAPILREKKDMNDLVQKHLSCENQIIIYPMYI